MHCLKKKKLRKYGYQHRTVPRTRTLWDYFRESSWVVEWDKLKEFEQKLLFLGHIIQKVKSYVELQNIAESNPLITVYFILEIKSNTDSIRAIPIQETQTVVQKDGEEWIAEELNYINKNEERGNEIQVLVILKITRLKIKIKEKKANYVMRPNYWKHVTRVVDSVLNDLMKIKEK